MSRILIVEDNPIFREEFRKRLIQHFPSAVVEEAGSGDEALRKIDVTSPHLVFMDTRLPGGNGLQLTKRIKAERPSIHIVILTAYDFPEYRQAALRYGADGFFVKDSFNWDELSEYIHSISKGVP